MRAKVGDTIKVTFKNNARFTTGLHPHGVLYSKASEGSPYDDGTPGKEWPPVTYTVDFWNVSLLRNFREKRWEETKICIEQEALLHWHMGVNENILLRALAEGVSVRLQHRKRWMTSCTRGRWQTTPGT